MLCNDCIVRVTLKLHCYVWSSVIATVNHWTVWSDNHRPITIYRGDARLRRALNLRESFSAASDMNLQLRTAISILPFRFNISKDAAHFKLTPSFNKKQKKMTPSFYNNMSIGCSGGSLLDMLLLLLHWTRPATALPLDS